MVGAGSEGFSQFGDGLLVGVMQGLDFCLEGLVDPGQVVEMPLAYLQIFRELFIDFRDLVVLGDDEVDLRASLLHQPIKPSAISLGMLPLITQSPPFLLLSGQLLDLFPNLVLHLLFLQFLGGNMILQLLAILLLIRDLALIDGDCSV